MSRQLRVLIPGGLYHVRARGNNRERLFLDENDCEAFLYLLGSVVEECSWICHAYCLMGNHYHLIVETPFPNLPRGMQLLNGGHAQDFNRRWDRVGHAFQGRYKATLAEKQAYLLELVRYVSLNPVRAGLCKRPEEWRWSSYRALAGLVDCPSWLTLDWILGQFAPERSLARVRLDEFVTAGISAPKKLAVRGDLYLATDAYLGQQLPQLRPMPEIPRAQWQPLRPPLAEILQNDPSPLHTARAFGYTLREIAELTGRHYSTISRQISRARGGSS